MSEQIEAVRCIKCNGKACVCQDCGKWAAHCMDCDQAIGEPGFYDPCAPTKEEATLRWNKLNTPSGIYA